MSWTRSSRPGLVRCVASRADGVDVFKGIPFAAPPFGANRLRPPEPPAAWSGVRDALAFGPEPPQPRPDDPMISAMVPDPAVPGEDCLNLNIWSPGAGSSGLPVMVWIPGGMFEVGTGASYDGSRFARDGVVCVTINYRVGAEGFLYLEDGTANLGLLDQVAALEWVRDNIAAFGGDPDNVTIFGQSAGAMSVGTLLSMPGAKGLFRRAIAESGAADRVVSADVALRIGRELAERLGVPATRDAIAAVPSDRLIAAQSELKADMLAHPDPTRWGTDVVASALPWQPVVDGDVIPGHPIDADRGRCRRGRRHHRRQQYRGLAVVRGHEWHRGPGHRRDPDRRRRGPRLPGRGRLQDAARGDARRIPCGPSGRGRRATALDHPDRLVVPDPGDAPGRCPRPRSARPRTCTNSPGHRLWRTASSAPVMRSRSASSSILSTRGRTRCSDRCSGSTRRNRSRPPCTERGSPSPRPGTPVGRSTSSIEGRPCASMSPRGSWMILEHPSGRSGNGCGSRRCEPWCRRRVARLRPGPPNPRGSLDPSRPSDRSMALGHRTCRS